MSTKIIAVTGATGAQGGGVINIMKNVPGWKIRAVTRNPSSDSAVKLSQSGIEVVRADFDDEASLVKAFQVGALSACLFFFFFFTATDMQSREFMRSSLSPTGGNISSLARLRMRPAQSRRSRV